MKPINICENRKKILESKSHIIIEGGPGSGKTTIGLLKAKRILDDASLLTNQKIVFLSFARATISRIEEQAQNLLTRADKKNLEITTYHAFAWSIVQSFGYLLKSHRSFKIITPPNLAAKIAAVDPSLKNQFKQSLLDKDGIICFDLFSSIAAQILEQSNKICSIISAAYPIIIVDEFQDTDNAEWQLIKLLGVNSTIIALADLDQRIYEFRGASIERIPEFTTFFEPIRFDLGKENNRSANTDIMQFGDDLLTSTNNGKVYNNVKVIRYPYYDDLKINLKYELLNCINRVKKINSTNNWSIAILVKSKAQTLSVSSFLTSNNLDHEVLIDPAGPSLSANVIASVLELQSSKPNNAVALLSSLINHIKGRKDNRPNQSDLNLAKALQNYLETGKISGSTRLQLLKEIDEIIEKRLKIIFTGIPEIDWLTIRKIFEASKHPVLTNVYEDARYIRLLQKGVILSEQLSEMWRSTGTYYRAVSAIDSALTREHFSMISRTFRGVIVMNIHKSKGKEFDEVIIWEEPYKPIAYSDSIVQDRLSARVAITRAKSFATFMTPSSKPSILI